jgi:hypothetical protein
MKLRRIGWAGHVAFMRVNAHKLLVGNYEGNVI